MELSIQKQIEAPVAIEKFSKIFGGIHKVDPETAKQMYEVEKFQFMSLVNDKSLTDVTPISAMGVFLDVVSNGLSFSSTAKHVYILSRNVKSGQKSQEGKDIYEKRMYFQTQPDGKIFQAQRAGSISHVTKPVIVYEGDEFAIETTEAGNQIIRHKVKFPRSQKIIAGYVYIVYPNGNREPFWMDMNDVARLAGYSSRQNSRWNNGKREPGPANELYSANGGQIDPGFFGAKLINGALKNIRKSGSPSSNEIDEDVVVEAQYTPPVEQQHQAAEPVTETTSTNSNEPF